MQDLLQLIYISRATFASLASKRGIEPQVARILAKSRANNRQAGLTGVLYFGDGCFFQCLEGDAGKVDRLFAILQHDERHTDVKLIVRKSITHYAFSDWSMKYVAIEKAIERLLQERGYSSFDPYLFDAEMTRALLDVLQTSDATESPLNVDHESTR